MRQGRLVLGMVLLAGVLGSVQVRATEGGGGAYPNGAEGFMTGAVPPPGNYLLDYTLWYNADKFMGPDGDELLPDFDLTVAGNILRYVHVTPKQVMGGNWAQQIFVPFLYMDVDHPALGSDDNTGLGDLIVDPVVLSWHKPNLHVAAGVDTYVPVGDYDEAEVANLGRNYWTFEPVVACTYLKGGYEASAKVMYDINLENDDTKVTSGDEFHTDFAVGKAIKQTKVGVGGFYYKQVTDDDYPAGYPPPAQLGKGEQLALGPEVSYQYGKLLFIAKYLTEFETENKPEGERVWLKIVAPLPW